MEYRWDIINYLINKYNYKYFGEIGYYKAYCFDNVKCFEKITIDPNPCKTPEQEKLPYRTISQLGENEVLIKETSDDYFKHLEDAQKLHGDIEYASRDLWFIDGLHKASQVHRDIQNCLKHLNKDGIILLHDCNPPTLEHTTTGDKHGNWNGDCYKALLQFIQNDFLGHYQVYTIDTDWGIGVIKPYSGPIAPPERSYSLDYNKAIEDWNYFDKNRNELLNVISVGEFKKLF